RIARPTISSSASAPVATRWAMPSTRTYARVRHTTSPFTADTSSDTRGSCSRLRRFCRSSVVLKKSSFSRIPYHISVSWGEPSLFIVARTAYRAAPRNSRTGASRLTRLVVLIGLSAHDAVLDLRHMVQLPLHGPTHRAAWS